MKSTWGLLITVIFFSQITPTRAQTSSLEYTLKAPRPLNKSETLEADFFTQNPQALANAKSSPPDDAITSFSNIWSSKKAPPPSEFPCDAAHGCHSLSEFSQILDCKNPKALGCQISRISEEPPIPGYTAVEVTERGKIKVGWLRTSDILLKTPPVTPATNISAPKPAFCAECSFKMNLERLKAMSHSILGKAKEQAPPPPVTKVEPTGLAAIYKLFSSNRKFSPLCYQFISPDLKYGPLGEYIRKTVLKYPGFMEPNNGVTNECANYDQFSPDEKADYFTYLFTAMTIEESGCKKEAVSGPEVTARNPSGESMGFLQLDSKPSLNKNHDRQAATLAKKPAQKLLDPKGFSGQPVCSTEFKPKKGSHKPVGPAILDPLVNLRCGISIMNLQLLREKNVFADNSFWSVIRDLDDAPFQMTKKYPGCRGPHAKP